MVCIYHKNDLDGWASGAIVKLRYPDCKLIGWEHGHDIPWEEIGKAEEVIMIDISFKMPDLITLIEVSRSVTLIDHHASKKKDFDDYTDNKKLYLNYVYDSTISACELGWKYLFPDKTLPYGIELLGQYDTWRENGTGRWNRVILPFQYGMRLICSSPETFPKHLFDSDEKIAEIVKEGETIIKYQTIQDELATDASAFEKEINGIKVLCMNQRVFAIDSVKSKYNPDEHKIVLGFYYTGSFWKVSLRSETIDVSEIAKRKGGGGHKFAAGFEVPSFTEIFML